MLQPNLHFADAWVVDWAQSLFKAITRIVINALPTCWSGGCQLFLYGKPQTKPHCQTRTGYLATTVPGASQDVNYIHFNPVKHGYADKALDCPYSSIHRYIYNGQISPDWKVLSRFMKCYRANVDLLGFVPQLNLHQGSTGADRRLGSVCPFDHQSRSLSRWLLSIIYSVTTCW